MKAADSEVPDAHFRGGQAERLPLAPRQAGPLLRACSGDLWLSLQLPLPHQTLSSASCRPSSQDMSVPGSGETTGPRCGRSPDAGHGHLLSCCRPFSCKSPALIWARFFPKARGPSSLVALLLWLFHVSCFPIFPCAVRESAGRPAAFFSFLSGSREVFSTGVSMPVLKGVLFFPGSVYPIFLLGHFSPSASELCVPLIQSLVGNPQQ